MSQGRTWAGCIQTQGGLYSRRTQPRIQKTDLRSAMYRFHPVAVAALTVAAALLAAPSLAYDVKFDDLLDPDAAQAFGRGFTAAAELQDRVRLINATADSMDYSDEFQMGQLERSIGTAIQDIANAKRRTELLVIHDRVDVIARGLFATISQVETDSGKTIYESGTILSKRAEECNCGLIESDIEARILNNMHQKAMQAEQRKKQGA